MHEIDLGTVDAAAGQLNELLGDTDPRLQRGRFHIVGRRDERGGVRTGALVQHVGNDQWSVYLLNEQQLEKVAHRQLQELGRESGGVPTEMTTEAGITLAAHAIGPVGVALAPLAEVASIAGSALGLGGESSATKIARKLAASGVAPSDVGRVAQEVRATTGENGAASGGAQDRSAETDGDRRPDGGGARTAASIEVPDPVTESRDAARTRVSTVGLAGEVMAAVEPTIGVTSNGRIEATESASHVPDAPARDALAPHDSGESVEARVLAGPAVRDDRYDMPHDSDAHANESHETFAASHERYDIPVPAPMPIVKPRVPSRAVESLGLDR